MPESVDHSSARKTRPVSRTGRHPVILRVSSLVVASILSLLLINAVVPPIVADQSDRAVINAPVALLTAPIDGEIDSLKMSPGGAVQTGDTLARISNVRLDRTTLISLEEKASDAREKLAATQGKKDSDRAYLKTIDSEIENQIEQLKAQFQSQIVELRARVAQSESLSAEKKALVDRQSDMVARDAASTYMLRPTTQQYSAALHNADAETRSSIRKSHSSMPWPEASMWETTLSLSVPSFRSAGTLTLMKREWKSRKSSFPRFWKTSNVLPILSERDWIPWPKPMCGLPPRATS
jgi:multidrug resistance efflux pump